MLFKKCVDCDKTLYSAHGNSKRCRKCRDKHLEEYSASYSRRYYREKVKPCKAGGRRAEDG